MHFFQQQIRSEPALAARHLVAPAPQSKVGKSQTQLLPEIMSSSAPEVLIVYQRFPELIHVGRVTHRVSHL